MGEVIACLVALPFVALADWFRWINGQRHPELARACHGVGMLALVAYGVSTVGLVKFIAQFVANPGNFFWVLPAGMAAWGLGWFLLYARHAALAVAPPYRAALTVRALLKIGVGWGMWAYAGVVDPRIALPLHIVAVWCLSTGFTKLGLMLWGKRRGQAEQMVQGDIARQEFDWNEGKMR